MDEVTLIGNKKTFKDFRGKFSETYSKQIYSDYGITKNFIVDCYSINNRNVIRGMHYQWDKPLDKLITVLYGAILDVVVDIRSESKNFGKAYRYELSDNNGHQLWVPAGFAHGFLSLEDKTHVSYKFTELYNQDGEGGIDAFDKTLDIPWGVDLEDVIRSEKDASNYTFLEYKNNPKF
jgi:dTDP-4-dehydrorhamnose 3,5-epimerase